MFILASNPVKHDDRASALLLRMRLMKKNLVELVCEFIGLMLNQNTNILSQIKINIYKLHSLFQYFLSEQNIYLCLF